MKKPIIDPWESSIDDAMAYDKKFNKNEPFKNHAILKVSAVDRINKLKEYILKGDGFSLLDAVNQCAIRELVMPNWLSREFTNRYREVVQCRAASWDEVFGKPYPGKHIKKLRLRRELRFAVLNKINELLSSITPPPIDKNLFN